MREDLDTYEVAYIPFSNGKMVAFKCKWHCVRRSQPSKLSRQFGNHSFKRLHVPREKRTHLLCAKFFLTQLLGLLLFWPCGRPKTVDSKSLFLFCRARVYVKHLYLTVKPMDVEVLPTTLSFLRIGTLNVSIVRCNAMMGMTYMFP